ncbi:hypothetical protein JHW43_000869 [Diplocarpon mali]|nr:hypothetical protein JHW43_000869 [Diplocarpon mali]
MGAVASPHALFTTPARRPLSLSVAGTRHHLLHSPATPNFFPDSCVRFGGSATPDEAHALRSITEHASVPVSKSTRCFYTSRHFLHTKSEYSRREHSKQTGLALRHVGGVTLQPAQADDRPTAVHPLRVQCSLHSRRRPDARLQIAPDVVVGTLQSLSTTCSWRY